MHVEVKGRSKGDLHVINNIELVSFGRMDLTFYGGLLLPLHDKLCYYTSEEFFLYKTTVDLNQFISIY